nr:helix-turn-helix domain-containing protein [Ornithinimicrobium sp. HY1793]
MHELLVSLSRCLREGNEIVAVDSDSTITPSRAASSLGMSRSHLYKLLDSGEIPFHRVGRDRRIRFSDLTSFEEQRQSDRHELAERFASQQRTREGAIEELVDLI